MFTFTSKWRVRGRACILVALALVVVTSRSLSHKFLG